MSPKHVAAVFRTLKSSDPEQRREGLLTLAALANRPLDFARLRVGPSGGFRIASAKSGGRHAYRQKHRPPDEIFDRVIKILAEDSHTRVRWAAAIALAAWGTRGHHLPGATGAVLENLGRIRDRHRQPESAFVYLRTLIALRARSEEAAREILRFLFDPEEAVRLAAGAALGFSGVSTPETHDALRESIQLDFRVRDRTLDLDLGARQSMIALGRLSRSDDRAGEALDFLCDHICSLHRNHRGVLRQHSQYLSIFAWILSTSNAQDPVRETYIERFEREFIPHRELLRRPAIFRSPPESIAPETQIISGSRGLNRLQLLAAMSGIARELLLPAWESRYSEDWLPLETLDAIDAFARDSDHSTPGAPVDVAANQLIGACKPNQWCTPATFAACWGVESVAAFARNLMAATPEARQRPVDLTSSSDDAAASLRTFLEFVDRAVLSSGAGPVAVASSGRTLQVPAFGGADLSLHSRYEALHTIVVRLAKPCI
ncbi:MAG: hypothetical protein NXI24_12260 [bacterium]|nr:hypothetical protein [bacterium]